MTKLIPTRTLLDVEFPLRHRAKPPAMNGTLRGWTNAELLPPLSMLDDETPFAPVWACWNDDGLMIACRVEGKTLPPKCDPSVFWQSDHLRLCTDMRDARTNRRATRFCQQFYFLPTGGGDGKMDPSGGSAKIQRARDDAPLYSSVVAAGAPQRHPRKPTDSVAQDDHIVIAASLFEDGYCLEARIPRDCLSGFDPAEHPRIGFYYMLEDCELGQQYLTVGDDLNWYTDPSTWATAVLSK